MTKIALVIDDNEQNLTLEKDLLEVAGFKVLEAKSSSSAIHIAIQERPDIIVMDVRLPDMPGTASAVILRQHPETKDIPIVFVTASVMEGAVREDMNEISNCGFIGKPLNTRTFAKEITLLIK